MAEVKVQKVPTGKHHPGYGCAILIIAISVFGGSVCWWMYSGLEQDRQISTFTVPSSPTKPQVANPTAEQKEDLKKRLAEFAKASSAGPAKLSLNVTDLNTLIILCQEAGIKDADYRGMIWFSGMDDKSQKLKADICLTMHGLPFLNRPDRYLVGRATFKPDIGATGMDLHIDNVEVPGKLVPEGFLFSLQALPWLNLVKTKPEFEEVLKRVTSAQVMPDQTLVLEAKPVPPAK